MTFAHEEVAPADAGHRDGADAHDGLVTAKSGVPVTSRAAPQRRGAAGRRRRAGAGDAPAAVDASRGPLTSEEVAGHRIWVLLFDTSSMQPEDVQKAADAAIKWGKERMSPADLVAIASIGSTLQILSDFTNDKDKIVSVLQGICRHRRHGDRRRRRQHDGGRRGDEHGDHRRRPPSTPACRSSTRSTTTSGCAASRRSATACCRFSSTSPFSTSAPAWQRNGSDNAVESRAAVNACSRANTSINPVDSRGLQAVVAGGSARQGSRGGVARVLGPRRRAAVRAARGAAGNAAVAGRRHRRHGVHRLQRLRRGVRQDHDGDLVVLHPRLRAARTRSRTARTARSKCG